MEISCPDLGSEHCSESADVKRLLRYFETDIFQRSCWEALTGHEDDVVDIADLLEQRSWGSLPLGDC